MSLFVAFRILGLAAVAMFGVWLSGEVWRALRTGAARVRSRDLVRRRTQPWFYWMAVVAQAGFAVACFLGVAVALLRLG